jgi:DNA-binding transcriptional LysR family regulator
MLRELKTFLAVAQHGTFAAAGLHIGLTQSAVSAQIRNLEQALGVRLFDRTGRQAILNPAGQRACRWRRKCSPPSAAWRSAKTPASFAAS